MSATATKGVNITQTDTGRSSDVMCDALDIALRFRIYTFCPAQALDVIHVGESKHKRKRKNKLVNLMHA